MRAASHALRARVLLNKHVQSSTGYTCTRMPAQWVSWSPAELLELAPRPPRSALVPIPTPTHCRSFALFCTRTFGLAAAHSHSRTQLAAVRPFECEAEVEVGVEAERGGANTVLSHVSPRARVNARPPAASTLRMRAILSAQPRALHLWTRVHVQEWPLAPVYFA